MIPLAFFIIVCVLKPIERHVHQHLAPFMNKHILTIFNPERDQSIHLTLLCLHCMVYVYRQLITPIYWMQFFSDLADHTIITQSQRYT